MFCTSTCNTISCTVKNNLICWSGVRVSCRLGLNCGAGGWKLFLSRAWSWSISMSPRSAWPLQCKEPTREENQLLAHDIWGKGLKILTRVLAVSAWVQVAELGASSWAPGHTSPWDRWSSSLSPDLPSPAQSTLLVLQVPLIYLQPWPEISGVLLKSASNKVANIAHLSFAPKSPFVFFKLLWARTLLFPDRFLGQYYQIMLVLRAHFIPVR